jgi:transcriptional regulator with XRE-family HTH domain
MKTEELSSPMGIESASTNTIREQMIEGFQASKEYRHGFVEEATRTRIATQIKTIREQREWNYKKFAEEIGKKISWVYRLEDPNEAPPTIPTLLRVAEAFDVGLDVRFRSFSELLADVTTLGPDSFDVPSFCQEMEGGSFSRARRRRKIRANCRRHRPGVARAKEASRTQSHKADANIGASAQKAFALVG